MSRTGEESACCRTERHMSEDISFNPPLGKSRSECKTCSDLSVHRDFTLWMFVSVHFTIYSSGSLEASRVQARKASSFASLFFGEAWKNISSWTPLKCSDLSQITSIYLYVWLKWNHCSEELCQGKLCKPPSFHVHYEHYHSLIF